mgnify:CR=1 FL=1
MEKIRKNERITIDEYRSYFLDGLEIYLNSPLIIKNGNVVESAYVFSFRDYIYEWLPQYIKNMHGAFGMLSALDYAHQIENDEVLGKYINDFKNAIESLTERYLIAKDGVNYLKEIGNLMNGEGNVIIIEYKKKDDK